MTQSNKYENEQKILRGEAASLADFLNRLAVDLDNVDGLYRERLKEKYPKTFLHMRFALTQLDRAWVELEKQELKDKGLREA